MSIWDIASVSTTIGHEYFKVSQSQAATWKLFNPILPSENKQSLGEKKNYGLQFGMVVFGWLNIFGLKMVFNLWISFIKSLNFRVQNLSGAHLHLSTLSTSFIYAAVEPPHLMALHLDLQSSISRNFNNNFNRNTVSRICHIQEHFKECCFKLRDSHSLKVPRYLPNYLLCLALLSQICCRSHREIYFW